MGRRRLIGKNRESAPPVNFARVLNTAMQEDDGVVLRIAAWERIVGMANEKPGWTGRFKAILHRRSWKIFDRAARFERANQERRA